MKARALINGASFGPETVRAMGEAFDQARARIAPTFNDTEVETARLKLAGLMLSVATEGHTDVEDLQGRAIIAMATNYNSCIRRE